MRDEAKFEGALKLWVEKSANAIDAREQYRKAWAQQYVLSTEKTDTAKKASADTGTSELRTKRDVAQLSADAAYHLMIFLRGPEVIVSRGEE